VALSDAPRLVSFKPSPINLLGMDMLSTDWDKFREVAKVHGDHTQAEMAQFWEGDISARTISRALQKVGLTRKKRPTA